MNTTEHTAGNTTPEPYIPDDRVGELPEMPPRRGGKRLHKLTVRRWILDGRKVGNRRVRLRAVRIGATLCTKRSWLDEFFAACAGSDDAGTAATATANNANADAERILAGAGV